MKFMDYVDLQILALNTLLDETFSHANKITYEKYSALAKENAKVTTRTAIFFTYKGVIYPNKTPNGISTKGLIVLAPNLRPQFYTEFENINNILEGDFQFNSIKNFFSSVLQISKNKIVLDTFLPNFLIASLKKKLGETAYQVLDSGNYSIANSATILNETIEETQSNIKAIEEHYAPIIKILKNQLITQFLLQE